MSNTIMCVNHSKIKAIIALGEEHVWKACDFTLWCTNLAEHSFSWVQIRRLTLDNNLNFLHAIAILTDSVAAITTSLIQPDQHWWVIHRDLCHKPALADFRLLLCHMMHSLSCATHVPKCSAYCGSVALFVQTLQVNAVAILARSGSHITTLVEQGYIPPYCVLWHVQ